MANRKGVIFAEERKQMIVSLINSDKKIIIPDLCSRFGVSASTIRNDLRDLQEAGLITRTHGGAIINTKSGFEPLPLDKQSRMHEAKVAIAKKAATLVEDGDIIGVGTGTTTFEFVKLLAGKRDVTVILNDIYFAITLERIEGINVIVTGGTLRKNFHYLQIPAGANNFNNMNIDKAFISCNGIHVERGITTPDSNLAHYMRQMISASSEKFVLCDSSKIGTVSFSHIADADQMSCIITDDNIDEEAADGFRDLGVELMIVDV